MVRLSIAIFHACKLQQYQKQPKAYPKVTFHTVICSKISSNIADGITPLSLAPFRPCVPVFDPRGAASWHLSPFLHMGLGFHQVAFVQISVGFMRLSPYWQ